MTKQKKIIIPGKPDHTELGRELELILPPKMPAREHEPLIDEIEGLKLMDYRTIAPGVHASSSPDLPLRTSRELVMQAIKSEFIPHFHYKSLYNRRTGEIILMKGEDYADAYPHFNVRAYDALNKFPPQTRESLAEAKKLKVPPDVEGEPSGHWESCLLNAFSYVWHERVRDVDSERYCRKARNRFRDLAHFSEREYEHQMRRALRWTRHLFRGHDLSEENIRENARFIFNPRSLAQEIDQLIRFSEDDVTKPDVVLLPESLPQIAARLACMERKIALLNRVRERVVEQASIEDAIRRLSTTSDRLQQRVDAIFDTPEKSGDERLFADMRMRFVKILEHRFPHELA